MPTSRASAVYVPPVRSASSATYPVPTYRPRASMRHHERQSLGVDLLGQQGHLRVAEDRGRDDPEDDHARRGDDRRRRVGPQRVERPADAQPDERAEHHLVRPDAEQPGQRAEDDADHDRPEHR